MEAAATPTPAGAELREVRGPSAFGDRTERFWELVWVMAVTDFRVQYANTFLGYVWTILRPLIFFGVIFLVLREIIRFGDGIRNYGLMLIVNLVLFQYFADVTSRGLRSLQGNEPLLRKMRFPRIIIPLSVSLTGAFTLAFNLIAVLALLLISGLEPRLSWLLLVVVLAGLFVLATGVAMLLSVLFVRSRDVAQGWSLISRMMFYLSPVLFPIELVPESFRQLVAINPLAPLLEQARVWVVDPEAPSAAAATDPLIGVVVPLALLFGLAGVGLWLFARDAPRVAENI